jgi:hypothetical protein
MNKICLFASISGLGICGDLVASEKLGLPDCEYSNTAFAAFNSNNSLRVGIDCDQFRHEAPFEGPRHASTIRPLPGQSFTDYSGFRVIVKPAEGKNLRLATIVAMDHRFPLGPTPTDRYYDRVPSRLGAHFSFKLEGMYLVTEYHDFRANGVNGHYMRDEKFLGPLDLKGTPERLGELHLDVRMIFTPPATPNLSGKLSISVCTSRGARCRIYRSSGYNYVGESVFGQLPPDLELGLEIPNVAGAPREAAFCRIPGVDSATNYTDTCPVPTDD